MTTRAEWNLATEDTAIRLSVRDHRVFIESLRNPARGWEWVPKSFEVPLPGGEAMTRGGGKISPDWVFEGAEPGEGAGGQTVTLVFRNENPRLVLKSVWQALPGPGPVENWTTVENKSGGAVTFTRKVIGGQARLRADRVMVLHRVKKVNVGRGIVLEDVIYANSNWWTETDVIPLVLLDAGAAHGFYMGLEWELGGFGITAGEDLFDVTVTARPITEDVVRGDGESFLIPSVYYGVYSGDRDDGSNRFKRWFWNHKITRSLHDNPGEPWVEVCMQELGGNGAASITGTTPQSAYDKLAATGAECVKVDFWDGTGECWYRNRDWQYRPEVWPNGFDFAVKAHRAGLKASLYMGGTYNDGDLTTRRDRDAELEAVRKRYDEGWFDMWRTDLYTAPKEPMPQTYDGVTNFLHIHDQMISSRPGYRYENCCNGGKYKGFAICRRMTFCTMNDIDRDPVQTRTTYYSDTFAINPVQLKSDLGPALTPYFLRTDMLGSILTWAADNPVYREHIALYKARQRPILRGCNVYHILPMPDGVNWDGLEFYNPDIDRGSVFLFKPSREAVAGDSKVIRFKGLDRDSTYDLEFQDRKNLNCRKTGAALMDEGVEVSGMTGDNASEIIWIRGPGGK